MFSDALEKDFSDRPKFDIYWKKKNSLGEQKKRYLQLKMATDDDSPEIHTEQEFQCHPENSWLLYPSGFSLVTPGKAWPAWRRKINFDFVPERFNDYNDK